MNKCKICNKDLYQDISFKNIFKINYTVHSNCLDNIVINNDSAAFPIDGNTVYYDYLFFEIREDYNFEYLEEKYLSILIQRNIESMNWSILIFYERGLFDGFSSDDMQILFSLANSPILIISFIYYDMSIVLSDII